MSMRHKWTTGLRHTNKQTKVNFSLSIKLKKNDEKFRLFVFLCDFLSLSWSFQFGIIKTNNKKRNTHIEYCSLWKPFEKCHLFGMVLLRFRTFSSLFFFLLQKYSLWPVLMPLFRQFKLTFLIEIYKWDFTICTHIFQHHI